MPHFVRPDRSGWILARYPEKEEGPPGGGRGCIMNSLINYQEAASNLITIPATRRACLHPRWHTSPVYLRPKESVLPRRQPDVSREREVLRSFLLTLARTSLNADISRLLVEIDSHGRNLGFLRYEMAC